MKTASIFITIVSLLLAMSFTFINEKKVSENLESDTSIPGNHDLSEGTYLIRSAVTNDKYLDVDEGNDGETITLNKLGDDKNDNLWIVKKVDGPLGGYTIRNKKYSNKYIDADFMNTAVDGCKVQLWKRTGPQGNVNPLDGGNPIPTNQEWYIQVVNSSKSEYKVINLKSTEMCLDAKDDGSADSRVKLWRKIKKDRSQVWVFERQ